jgi:hypothetical protein
MKLKLSKALTEAEKKKIRDQMAVDDEKAEARLEKIK